MVALSVLIPCRGEEYQVQPGVSVLARTVQDLIEKAEGEIEVIVVFDGPPYQRLPNYPELVVIEDEWRGTKLALNKAAEIATGEYLLKTDAHCMFAPGFDRALIDGAPHYNHGAPAWIAMPRFYVLDAEHWQWQDSRFYDYFTLPCPFTYRRGFMFQAGGHWGQRTQERLAIPIDENLKLHGSCFFLRKDYWDALGGLSTDSYDTWNGEDIELTMKTWLGPWDGVLAVNKTTWYAHMHRGAQRPREYGYSQREPYRSAAWSTDYWMNNRWEGRAHDIEWLVDRFWPLPGWSDNWKELPRG